jgi:hypothetical protein
MVSDQEMIGQRNSKSKSRRSQQGIVTGVGVGSHPRRAADPINDKQCLRNGLPFVGLMITLLLKFILMNTSTVFEVAAARSDLLTNHWLSSSQLSSTSFKRQPVQWIGNWCNAKPFHDTEHASSSPHCQYHHHFQRDK